jgi:hypothetical protein
MSANSAPRRAPRRGWLGGVTRRPAAVLGSRPYGRPRAIPAAAFRGTRAYHGNWYTAAPSGEWLRHSRHPWRKRSQRLLRLVGVGR